jgi:hypothetical protein
MTLVFSQVVRRRLRCRPFACEQWVLADQLPKIQLALSSVTSAAGTSAA